MNTDETRIQNQTADFLCENLWRSVALPKSILELLRQHVEINRDRIVPMRRSVALLFDCVQIICERAAFGARLGRFKPIQVVVDLVHSTGEVRAQDAEPPELLAGSRAFAGCEERRDLLIFGNDRTQN